MNRRRLLRQGLAATTATAAVAQGGCAHLASPEAAALPASGPDPAELPDPATVEQILASFDRRLDWIARADVPRDLAVPPREPRTPDEARQREERAELVRQSLRTLYLTGRFLDLPDEIKVHPGMQDRIFAAQDEMDRAVLGTTALLESLGPAEHAAIQATLRARPDIGEQLAALIDGPAREDGIPFPRRMSLRTSTLDLARKMQSQSPALTIDPYVRRVRRLEARQHDPSERARILAARIGEAAFWEHQQKLADLQRRWEVRLAQSGAPAPAPAPAPTPSPAPTWPPPDPKPPTGPSENPPAPQGYRPPAAAPKPQRTRGQQTVSTGGKIMGFGLGSVAVGLVFAGLGALFNTEALLWPTLIFGVTVGPILLVVGLIVVIVGAIMTAAE